MIHFSFKSQHAILMLFILSSLFLQSSTAIVKTGSITKISQIPNDLSYNVFSSKFKLQFLLLCDKTSKKNCNEKQVLLQKVQKQFDNIGFALVEISHFNSIPQEKLIYEGFPTIYYISHIAPYEREVLTFNLNQETLIRFIKSKQNPYRKQIPDEQTLIKSLQSNYATRAIVLLGNVSLNDEVLSYTAKIGEFRMIYQLSQHNLTQNKNSVAVYYKNSTKEEYENKIIELGQENSKVMFGSKVLFALKEGNNKDFNSLTMYDIEIALEKNIPSMIYVYNTQSDLDYIKNKINSTIVKYQDKLSFSQSSIYDEYLTKLNMKELLKIDDSMLPGFICLIPSNSTQFNYDDISKYYIPFNQGFNITNRLEDILSYNNQTGKRLFTDNEENINSISLHIKNKEEFLLLICPSKIMKYRRITQRIKRALTQIRKLIIYEEIDPFTNEIDFMTYDYVPTLAYIIPTKNSKDIIIRRLESDFTTERIFFFIKEHTSAVIDSSFHISSSILSVDKENPLYAIHKHRYERRLLGHAINSQHVGLRRMWWSLKAIGLIIKGKNDQKFISDYFTHSIEDYEKTDYAKVKKAKANTFQPKTEL